MIISEQSLQRRRTAFHESAHSVFLVRVFQRLDFVTIKSTDQYWGQTRTCDKDWFYLAPNDDLQIAHTAKLCTMLLCGAAAVKRLLGEIEQGHVSKDLSDTHELLQKLIEDGDQQMNAFNRLWRHAQDVVEQEWDSILAVADELMQKETLTGEEVVRVIKEQKGELC